MYDRQVISRFTFAAAVAVWPAVAVFAAEPSSGDLKFVARQLMLDPNEGCAVADVNNDGRPDIIAGRNWYAAPDFAPRPIRHIEEWNGYLQNNGDHAYDVNGDGWVDVVSGSFLPTEVYWYENPQATALAQGRLWPRHLLVDTEATQNEASFLRDLDGDGVPEWIANSWNKTSPLLAWSFSAAADGRPQLARHVIGSGANGHGMAFGDLNGDGREDILVGTGWYERPAGDPLAKPWTFHADWDLHASCPMTVVDVDDDGRRDLVWGNGHDFGLFWWRQLLPDERGKLRFEEHVIDEEYSQPHCLHWADLDGDGADELITGKRKFAHNGRDPGGQEAPCLYYYTYHAAQRVFQRHTIDVGHVGTGLQIRTADLNGDDRLDIAVSGKSGTYVLLNQGF